MSGELARERKLKLFWNLGLIVVGVGLLVLILLKGRGANFAAGQHFVFLVTLAFVAEYVDSSLGMGYGTTLTPILLIMGFAPLQVVPLVLLSEFLSGVTAGLLHHRCGNVDFGRGTEARKVVWILASCSVVGTLVAVLLAVSLPKTVVKLYISGMILAMGLFILLGRFIAHKLSWRRIIALGTIAAFNKGISGGGYGPLVTGGQILAGVSEKKAVGITSLVEGLVCIVGLITYLLLHGMPEWGLGVPLVLGAMLSVPMATWTVRVLPERLLRRSIGYATGFLGLLTLVKTLT